MLQLITPGCVKKSLSKLAYCSLILFASGHITSIANGWSWGSNDYGQLGIGNTDDSHVPAQMNPAYQWTSIAGGDRHTIAVRSDGTLWAWGYNNAGQLGDGTDDSSLVPKQIGTDNDWSTVAAGGEHSFALKNNGTLWGWGENYASQLGDGTTDPRSTPAQVGNATWTAISTSTLHVIGIQSDGTLWTWGFNAMGQLGTGDTDERTTPTLVDDGTDWHAVAAGRYHSLALRDNGTLWSWGYAALGALGNGPSEDDVEEPTQVGEDSDWWKITAGEFYSLAIKTNGTLWSWGDNYAGQLGNGDTDPTFEPGQVGEDNNWTEVVSACGHVLALKNNGTLWAWGDNVEGMVGNNSTDDVYSPLQIGTYSDWSYIAAGLQYSFGVRCASSSIIIEGPASTVKFRVETYEVDDTAPASYQWSAPTLGEIQGSDTSSEVDIRWTVAGTDTVRVTVTPSAGGCSSQGSLVVTIAPIICTENPSCAVISSAVAECMGATGNIMSYRVTFEFSDILSTANFIRISEYNQEGKTYTFPFNTDTIYVEGERRIDELENDPVMFIIEVYDITPEGKATRCKSQQCVMVECVD